MQRLRLECRMLRSCAKTKKRQLNKIERCKRVSIVTRENQQRGHNCTHQYPSLRLQFGNSFLLECFPFHRQCGSNRHLGGKSEIPTRTTRTKYMYLVDRILATSSHCSDYLIKELRSQTTHCLTYVDTMYFNPICLQQQDTIEECHCSQLMSM